MIRMRALTIVSVAATCALLAAGSGGASTPSVWWWTHTHAEAVLRERPPVLKPLGDISKVFCNGFGASRRVSVNGAKTYKTLTCYVGLAHITPATISHYLLGSALFRMTVYPTEFEGYRHGPICDFYGDGRDYPLCANRFPKRSAG